MAPAAAATSNLENPQPASRQSGIGVVSGWHCTASKIEIEVDGGTRYQAGTRTECRTIHRGDNRLGELEHVLEEFL